jgi:phosphate:Na+ symporter
MALTLVMCHNGWIPFEIAAAMVLGENIGTTVTAYLASLVGNVHAKRAARAHFIFNIFGVVWMIGLLHLFLKAIDAYMFSETGISPLSGDSPESIPIALSIFHSVFNILNVLFLVGFVKLIVRIVEKMIPSQGEEDEEHHLEFINGGITATPEISIYNAKQEIIRFGEVTYKMHNYITELVSSDDKKRRLVLIEKISKYEDITDQIEVEVADYLAKTAQVELSAESSLKVRGMLGMITDLERVGDIYFQMSKGVERMIEKGISLREEQKINLTGIFTLLENAHKIMMENLNKVNDKSVTIDSAIEAEQAINACRNELRKILYKSIESNKYEVENSMIYNDLFSRSEKVGDHLINVTEAIIGEKD